MKIKANETVNKQEQDLISGRHINSLFKDKHNFKVWDNFVHFRTNMNSENNIDFELKFSPS